MKSAARGMLSLPSAEMFEIVVLLTDHPIFGDEARETLASWDGPSLFSIACDPATSANVLDYLSGSQTLRPRLLPGLLRNAAVAESRLAELAWAVSTVEVSTMLTSKRVRSSWSILAALARNPGLSHEQAAEVARMRISLGSTVENVDEPLEPEILEYLLEHAEEIKAAEAEPFQLLGAEVEGVAETTTSPEQPGASSEAAAARRMAIVSARDGQRESVVQKIARLSVGERVLLAMKGNKDERFILIRDGARVVCNAVLESPKLTESEVESYAGMKNVNESVLRVIAMKKKFLKNYNIIRVLTANPKCPIDTAVPLVPRLLTADLKNLSINKNVAETVRKLAFKMYRDRLASR
jgi:hypothetical protein